MRARTNLYMLSADRLYYSCVIGIYAAAVTRNSANPEGSTGEPQDQYLLPFLASNTL